jgi:hypothetical protein
MLYHVSSLPHLIGESCQRRVQFLLDFVLSFAYTLYNATLCRVQNFDGSTVVGMTNLFSFAPALADSLSVGAGAVCGALCRHHIGKYAAEQFSKDPRLKPFSGKPGTRLYMPSIRNSQFLIYDIFSRRLTSPHHSLAHSCN